MTHKPKVAIITSFPRAQRIHVYNEMARLNEIDFRVFYLRKMPHGRHWEYGPSIEHDAVFIPELRLRPHLYLSPGLLRAYRDYSPDLMIMTQYASLGMQLLMYHDSIFKHPWVFWSEIPHVLYAENPIIRNEKLRAFSRYVALVPIRYWSCEVWGIGKRAVKAFEEIVNKNIPVRNLPYYADLDQFFSVEASRSMSSCVRFLFSGSLSLRKGADVVAEAIQYLSDNEHNFEVHIAGKGPLTSCFEKLTKNAREKVTLYGFLQLNEIPDAYCKADILIFPSRHDGWGMTLPEGLAAGMPAISTTQTGAAVDMIRDGVNGILLKNIDKEHLANAMLMFIKNPDLIPKMGSNAIETAKRYTHQIGAHIFTDMIKRVCDGFDEK